jgi:vacuolar-type H+-ATPase subunit I/STV1
MIEEYKVYMLKEKTIYGTMNLFKSDSNIYQCKCWCPKEKENLVISTLQQVSVDNVDIAGGQF